MYQQLCQAVGRFQDDENVQKCLHKHSTKVQTLWDINVVGIQSKISPWCTQFWVHQVLSNFAFQPWMYGKISLSTAGIHRHHKIR